MVWMRVGWRWLRLIWHVLSGVVITLVCTGMLHMTVDTPFFQRRVQAWLMGIVSILGGQLRVFGQVTADAPLLVANHISWLDIAVLGGVFNPRFLSKAAVRHWPVIGWLAVKTGTLFISRGQSGAANQAANTIRATLESGHSVVFFPEGTTSDGTNVRVFHARLFASAFDANVRVKPVALRYLTLDGMVHEKVPYIEEQSLLTNLKGLLREPAFVVEVHVLPSVDPQSMSRKQLAAVCEQSIRTVVIPSSTIKSE